MTGKSDEITPALRFHGLTPLYDSVVRATTRERRFKPMLIEAAAINPGESVLDVGCGTGTLLKEIAEQVPDASLTGLDADPNILAIAARKLRSAGVPCELVEGHSTDMPIADNSVDHVVSTLFFHHLRPSDKCATVSDIWRVLRPGGSVHIADWGRPTGPIQRLAFYQIQWLDGFETTRDHVYGGLTALFKEVGFETVEEYAFLRTMFGTLRFIKARSRPQRAIIVGSYRASRCRRSEWAGHGGVHSRSSRPWAIV